MSIYFGKHNVSGTIKAISGMDTITVNVPFVPDYVKVEFHGPVLTPRDETQGDDEVFWDLTKVTATSYQLSIGWSVYETREIYYRASKLLVDPV